MRLNPDADTFEEAFKYFETITIQLYNEGYIVRHIEPITNIGVLAKFFKGDREYHSFYLYKSKRGKGIYKKLVREYNWNIITSNDCGLVPHFRKWEMDEETPLKVDYKVTLGFHDYQEYQIIKKYYGNNKAKKSGMPYMNHIDEGLAILHWIGASNDTKRSFCIHPIIQPDKELERGLDFLSKNSNIYGISTKIMAMVMEYRSVANSYLSSKTIPSYEEIKLSPISEVNKMLVADKIQNRKDFELYNKGSHPRSEELDLYFKNWLKRLGIHERKYNELKRRLNVRSQII